MNDVAVELFAKLQEEKKTGELLQLQSDYYVKLDKYAETKKDNLFENGKDKENIIKILSSLKKRRIQKILVYLAYEKPLPSQIPLEEEDLYNQIKKILNKEHVSNSVTKIRINVQVPEIITKEGTKLGPYKQNEIVELNKEEDINFILSNKIGEIAN
jgi:hypothetical protein